MWDAISGKGVEGLVSVVVPAHNARVTLARALRSIEAQTYRDIEVVLIDDASVDGTSDVARETVKHWREIAFTLVRLEQQGGVSAARNKGIEIARGEFIAFQDSDDEWLPEKTSAQIAALKSDPDLVFVTCEPIVVSYGKREIVTIHSSAERANGDDGWKTLLKTACIATPSVIVRRSALAAAGGFDASLQVAEDQDLWIRLALCGPIRHLEDCLLKVYRQSGGLMDMVRGQIKSTALPVILGHLGRARARLSQRESNQILASRYASTGRDCYESGQLASAFGYFAQASLHGQSVVGLVWYLLAASLPAQLLKRSVGMTPIAPSSMQPIVLEALDKPWLTVVLDACEVERGEKLAPSEMRALLLETIEVCQRFKAVPTLVVNESVLDDAEMVRVLRENAVAGKIEIATSLTTSGISGFNALCQLLERLTRRVESEIGRKPTIFKAQGNWFVPSLPKLLETLGYEVDLSVLPFASFRSRGGPNFCDFDHGPYFFGTDLQMVELPVTRAFSGMLLRLGPAFAPLIALRSIGRLGISALLSGAGLLGIRTLVVDGADSNALKKTARLALERGARVLSIHFALSAARRQTHSGASAECPPTQFEDFLRFFAVELAGTQVKVSDVFRYASKLPRHRASVAPEQRQ